MKTWLFLHLFDGYGFLTVFTQFWILAITIIGSVIFLFFILGLFKDFLPTRYLIAGLIASSVLGFLWISAIMYLMMVDFADIQQYGTAVQKANLQRCIANNEVTRENIVEIMSACKKDDDETKFQAKIRAK